MIQFQNVSKTYGQKTILRSIDVTLAIAQTHVLLGESGCGKSTLIKMACGLVFPEEGQVLIDDIAVTRLSRHGLLQNIGYVIQEGGLFPHLTARQNVTLVAETLQWPKDRMDSRLEELSQLVGFGSGIIDRFPAQLSGGQRQRVGIMRALMLDPDYLLLDEPLGALDPIVRSDLQQELKQIFNKLNKTVLLVTHDVAEAAFFGHTVTLLNQGAIEQHGSFPELARQPATQYVTDFISAQKPPAILRELLE